MEAFVLQGKCDTLIISRTVQYHNIHNILLGVKGQALLGILCKLFSYEVTTPWLVGVVSMSCNFVCVVF